ncbi:MAG: DUF2834 domain-containing protein [Pseudomonadota bacterium]
MRLHHLYLILCVVGFIVPYAEFVSWLVDNGIDIPAFFDAMLINGISRFFVWDVLISAVAVLVATYAWRDKLPVRWPPVVATLLIGVSLGLPLLLYLMEKQKTGGAPASAWR